MAVSETTSEDAEELPEDAAEEIEVELPEFDEEEYIREEIRDAKLAVATLGYAVVVAVVTRMIHLNLGNLTLAFLFGLAATAGLRWVFDVLGADVGDLDKKKWLGLGAVFFFSWLGFWTLLLNPPFV